MANSSLTFEVKRHAPELIAPATPTPRELKLLSDIDDQEGFRIDVVNRIYFYRSNPKMGNTNPASVIRDALGKVLVYFYPLAGRIKEGPGKKLMVDGTGEGVMFIEAEADVTLERFGKTLHPPFPCVEKLLCNGPGRHELIGSPLMQFQVTRLLCGGFIFNARIYHSMCDAQGMVQFLFALCEMAQGAFEPSILPVWQRELLDAIDPPCITFSHPEYDEVVDTEVNHISATDEMVEKSFFFWPTEISALRRFVPENLKTCTSFEVLTTCLWRCRTIALQPNPEQDACLIFYVNARRKFNPPIPIGYYGNCTFIPCAISKVGDLCNKPLEHALKLVIKAKSSVTEEYVRSTVDLMVVKGWPHFRIDHLTYIISAVTRYGFNNLNFGWGEPVYAGYPGDDPDEPGVFSGYTPFINDNGESGVVVIVGLPIKAMDRLVKELSIMLSKSLMSNL